MRRTDGRMDGRRDGGTDGQISPVFFRTWFLFGAEAPLTLKATINKPLSRARVPMTISCLWATGYTTRGHDIESCKSRADKIVIDWG